MYYDLILLYEIEKMQTLSFHVGFLLPHTLSRQQNLCITNNFIHIKCALQACHIHNRILIVALLKIIDNVFISISIFIVSTMSTMSLITMCTVSLISYRICMSFYDVIIEMIKKKRNNKHQNIQHIPNKKRIKTKSILLCCVFLYNVYNVHELG